MTTQQGVGPSHEGRQALAAIEEINLLQLR
jgi:hypothetical protein